MYYLTLAFKQFFQFMLIVFLMTITALANIPCPGIKVTDLHHTRVDVNQSMTERIGTVTTELGVQKSAYFYFTPKVSGTIEVRSRFTRGHNTQYIMDGCSGDILWKNADYNYRVKQSAEVFVRKNQKIVVRIQNRDRYDGNLYIDFIFKKTDINPHACSGKVVPNLEGTTTNAYYEFKSSTYNTMVGDKYTPYTMYSYYHFTPAVDGTVEIKSDFSRGYNTIQVEDACTGKVWWRDYNYNYREKRSAEIFVPAGKKLVFKIQNRENRYGYLETLKFDFKKTTKDPHICSGGKIVPNLQGATSNAYYEFKNTTYNTITGDKYTPYTKNLYYQFTPAVNGTVEIKSDFSYGYNTIQIEDACTGTVLWRDYNYNYKEKRSAEVFVPAGKKIVLKLENRENRFGYIQKLKFDFKKTDIDPHKSSGKAIPNLDGTTTDAYYVFKNTTHNTITGDKYTPYTTNLFYHFTPAVDGTLKLNSDFSRGYNTVQIEDASTGTVLWRDYNYNYRVKSSSEVFVSAGTKLVIKVQNREGNFGYIQNINFTFTKTPINPHSCPGKLIPNLNGTTGGAYYRYPSEALGGQYQSATSSLYYHFTPAVDGELIVDSKMSRNYNTIYIMNGCGTVLKADSKYRGTKQNRIAVSAGQHIVVKAQNRDNNIANMDIEFTYIIPIPSDTNGTCPGRVIPNLDGATNDAKDGFYSEILNGISYKYYYFTPNVNGYYDANSTATKKENSLQIKHNCSYSRVWKNSSDSFSKATPEYYVPAGRRIIFEVQNRVDEVSELNIDFRFRLPRPIDTCPGLVLPNIDHTLINAYDSFTNVEIKGRRVHYYSFTASKDGRFDVNVTELNRKNFQLHIYDRCGHSIWGRNSSSGYKSYARNVKAGEQFIVRINNNNDSVRHYDAHFKYIIPPKIQECPGVQIPNLHGAVKSEYYEFTNATVPYKQSYFYYFRPELAGKLKVHANAQQNFYVLKVLDGCSSELDSTNANTGGSSRTKDSKEVGIAANQLTVVQVYNKNGGNNLNLDLISFTYTVPPPRVLDDHYRTDMNTTLEVNSSNGFLLNDTGLNPNNTVVTVDTTLTQGTLNSYDNTGAFNYTPPADWIGVDRFIYSINGGNGPIEAVVLISVGLDSEYESNLGFELLNTDENTRNLIGNYEIAGNTVLCLTKKTSGYASSESECNDIANHTSNGYVAKFIDIDEDNSTWNSSSSNITLPKSYAQRGGNGVLWAGLIWQGRYAWYDGSEANTDIENVHYAVPGGSRYYFIETGKNTGVPEVTLDAGRAKHIKLKIDNGSYEDIVASKLYNIKGDGGRTFSAVANITKLVQSQNFAQGKHTFTVANLPTSEGREANPGLYGGWTVVIIYAESPLLGNPRNINIYGGMEHVENGVTPSPIAISGFKLPAAGTIKAKLGIFAGEGEYPYKNDGVDISEKGVVWRSVNSKNDKNNIFDALLDNIDRDVIANHKNNLKNNNVGIDVDSFKEDVTISGFDRNATSLYLRMWSDNDYIIPGMIAFSVELYQPKICWDYTVDIDGYVLESENNVIATPFGFNKNLPLTTRVSIQSQEADFDLKDVNVTYKINNVNELRYKRNTTALAKNKIFDYAPAGVNGYNQTFDETSLGFGMYIGDGAREVGCGDGIGCGGEMSQYQNRYLKFDHELQKNDINVSFDLRLNYRVNYGSGPLSLTKVLTTGDICRDAIGSYTPYRGSFNVTSSDIVNPNTGKPFNLPTQVTNRPFNTKIFSYNDIGSTLSNVDTAVEVEVYNVDYFKRDVNLSCNNPDSNISKPVFVHFNNTSVVDFDNLSYPIAIRNAGFRVWYLLKTDGSSMYHHCASRSDESCFENLYTTEYAGNDTHCMSECSDGTTSNCYVCLRRYYGTNVCSRDNFAIRPEALVTYIADSNQTDDIREPSIAIANSRNPSLLNLTNDAKNLVAGYNYRYDINATNYIDDKAVKGYYQVFDSYTPNIFARLNWKPSITVTDCNDTDNMDMEIAISNGTNIDIFSHKSSIAKLDQVGEYQLILHDENWTAVDWNPKLLAHHQSADFQGVDCLVDNDAVPTNLKVGCVISNKHYNNFIDVTYLPLDLRFYPYKFDIDSLNIGAGVNNITTNTNIYINSPYENDNMSFNIEGTIEALSFINTPLTNFTKGCYAEDIKMLISHTYKSDIPDSNQTPYLSYHINNIDTNNQIIIQDINKTLSKNNFDLILNKEENITIDQNKTEFISTMSGAINTDIGVNFMRLNNTPLNPRLIHFENLWITYPTAPLLNVDMNDKYELISQRAIDQDISFIYGRAKSTKYLYDDVIGDNITTPMTIITYCNLSAQECQDRGLLIDNAVTSDAYWWKSINHNTPDDGNVVLKLGNISGDGSGEIENNIIRIVSPEAIDNRLKVKYLSKDSYSLILSVVFDTDFTDKWLIYNQESETEAPKDVYKVRFIGGSSWSGVGKTGSVVKFESTNQKPNRMNW